MDRFTIHYDERGVQLHNDYIGAIAAGIVKYWEKRNITFARESPIYGIIHRDKKVLEAWEQILQKEGLL